MPPERHTAGAKTNNNLTITPLANNNNNNNKIIIYQQNNMKILYKYIKKCIHLFLS